MGVAEVVQLVTGSIWFYIALVLLVAIIVYLVVRKNAKKGVRRRLQDLEVRYASIKTIPLPFKLNKAVALSRVNEDISKQLESSQATFDQTQANIKSLSQMLTDTEDLLEMGKVRLAKQNNQDIAALLETTEADVNTMNALLDGILQQEVEQRDQINVLKEEFRTLRMAMNENSANYVYSFEALEQKVTAIEKMFSSFEEWMFASEFQKAAEVKDEIRARVDQLRRTLDQLPALLVRARGVLPRLMEEVNAAYSQARHKGVYLKHLETIKQVEIVSDHLKGDLHALKQADIDQVDEHLDDCQKRLQQLLEQIEKESKAYDEVKTMLGSLSRDVDKLSGMLTNVKEVYAKASMRFGFEDMESTIVDLQARFDGMKQEARTIGKWLEEGQKPYSAILLSLKELKQSVDIYFADVKVIQEKLNGACQDEEHAKTQLMKLYLIMNEMKSKVRKNRLPSISASYGEDLKTANRYISTMEDLLKEVPLNITRLNATLTEAVDFIYRLYNNVNKILGTANMVENALVFGNRYRSTYPNVDTELTRAELSYRNGEYTKALKIALNVIEKIHPETTEQLIKQNAQRAQA